MMRSRSEPVWVDTPLELWRITPECRARGVDVAWDDAISRLRKVYDTQLARFGDQPVTLSVSISRSFDASYQSGRQ